MASIKGKEPLFLGLAAGTIFAVLTLNLERAVRYKAIEILLIPGVVVSMAAGSVHSFPLWLAALGNFCFWTLLVWSVGSLVRKIHSLLTRRVSS